MKNFNSFSPNSIAARDDLGTIYLVAGDQGAELNIQLKDDECADSNDVFENLPDLDLTGVISSVLYFRNITTPDIVDIIACALPLDRTTGLLIMAWPPDLLDDKSGDYEGEVELTYDSGRISTAVDVLQFNIRKDFSGNGD